MIGAKGPGAESGYYARAAGRERDDLRLIKGCCDLAVNARSGGRRVIGHDEDRGGVLRAIEFDRIKGGKPFDTKTRGFSALLAEIARPAGDRAPLGAVFPRQTATSSTRPRTYHQISRRTSAPKPSPR